jgi:ferric-dicitrate binding protein FerR (iron transport regulator)
MPEAEPAAPADAAGQPADQPADPGRRRFLRMAGGSLAGFSAALVLAGCLGGGGDDDDDDGGDDDGGDDED